MRKMAVLAAVAALIAAGATPAWAAGPAEGVESRAVTFTVDNKNDSNLECDTDGGSYEIRGQIVGPRGGIDDADSATLYLHGLESGIDFWTARAEGASYVERLAADGKVSVVIDRLGYDSSDKPDGFDSCFGGQADIASQMLDDLRSGDYATNNGDTDSASFEELVLAGHSVGGLITELTANSFGNADGIVVISYSSEVVSDAALAATAAATETCEAGGSTTGGIGPDGYSFFAPTVEDFQAGFFLSADPAVVAAATAQRNKNPCGDILTFAAGQQTNLDNADAIDVPALVTIGEEDALFPPPAGPSEVEVISRGSDDVELKTLSPSNHAVTLEETAPEFAQGVSTWLTDNGF